MVRLWLGGWKRGASSFSNRLAARTWLDRCRSRNGRRSLVPEDLESRVLLTGNPTVYTVDLTSANGTSTVNNKDVRLVQQRVGGRLRRRTATTRVKTVVARPVLVIATRVVRDQFWGSWLKSR
jgi:DNA-directed RNA polymerase specialized sigma24 family protein